MDPNTFVTAVYVFVDDLCRSECVQLSSSKRATSKRAGSKRGRKPTLSSSEVVTLALLAQWHHTGSERAFIRFASQHWKGYFPLLSQSRFNRCVRKLGSLISTVGVRASRELSHLRGAVAGEDAGYEAIDGTVVALMRRCRGQRGSLFGRDEAWIGRGGSDKRWEYGIKLMASARADGSVTGFAAGPANTEERWLAEALLKWRNSSSIEQPSPEELQSTLGPAHRNQGRRLGPPGPLWPAEGAGDKNPGIYLSDRGLRGKAWQRHWRDDYGAKIVIRPEDDEDVDSALTPAEIRSRRQIVETVFHILKDSLGLNAMRVRTLSGLQARTAAKIAALNIMLLINRTYNRRPLSIFNPIA